MQIGGQKPTIGLDVKADGSRQTVFDYTLKADNDVPILMIVATIGVPAGGKSKAVLTKVDGSEQSIDLPMNPADFGAVNKITLTGPAWTRRNDRITGSGAVPRDPPAALTEANFRQLAISQRDLQHSA